MKTAIGEIKTEKTVYCEVCGSKHVRKMTEKVYENTEKDINRAKQELSTKISKPYTCKICKSILRS